MAFQNFEDLQVWQRSMDLAEQVYRATDGLRRFGLKDQIERSSLSIPSNIAEGQERHSPKEFARFLRIAKGSCGELRTQLMLAERIGVFNDVDLPIMIRETREISAMLRGLIRSVEKQIQSPA